jgi:hypothetical protein
VVFVVAVGALRAASNPSIELAKITSIIQAVRNQPNRLVPELAQEIYNLTHSERNNAGSSE